MLHSINGVYSITICSPLVFTSLKSVLLFCRTIGWLRKARSLSTVEDTRSLKTKMWLKLWISSPNRSSLTIMTILFSWVFGLLWKKMAKLCRICSLGANYLKTLKMSPSFWAIRMCTIWAKDSWKCSSSSNIEEQLRSQLRLLQLLSNDSSLAVTTQTYQCICCKRL